MPVSTFIDLFDYVFLLPLLFLQEQECYFSFIAPAYNSSSDKTKYMLSWKEVNILILDFLLTFPEIFRLSYAYGLVVRYVDEQVYCLDQSFFKLSIGTSKGSNGAR